MAHGERIQHFLQLLSSTLAGAGGSEDHKLAISQHESWEIIGPVSLTMPGRDEIKKGKEASICIEGILDWAGHQPEYVDGKSCFAVSFRIFSDFKTVKAILKRNPQFRWKLF